MEYEEVGCIEMESDTQYWSRIESCVMEWSYMGWKWKKRHGMWCGGIVQRDFTKRYKEIEQDSVRKRQQSLKQVASVSIPLQPTPCYSIQSIEFHRVPTGLHHIPYNSISVHCIPSKLQPTPSYSISFHLSPSHAAQFTTDSNLFHLSPSQSMAFHSIYNRLHRIPFKSMAFPSTQPHSIAIHPITGSVAEAQSADRILRYQTNKFSGDALKQIKYFMTDLLLQLMECIWSAASSGNRRSSEYF